MQQVILAKNPREAGEPARDVNNEVVDFIKRSYIPALTTTPFSASASS